MIHDKTIRVGACDWQHTRWQGVFYPDDLPEDWRLSYYANEFSCVLVPENRWRAEDAQLSEWADEVSDDFLFYFLSDNLSDKQTTRSVKDEQWLKQCLGHAFGGIVFQQDNTVACIEYKSKNLREWKNWLLASSAQVIFLMDKSLTENELTEFKSLIELMGI